MPTPRPGPTPFFRLEMIAAVIGGSLLSWYVLGQPIKEASERLQFQKQRQQEEQAAAAASEQGASPAAAQVPSPPHEQGARA
jgi:hypothetical protein